MGIRKIAACLVLGIFWASSALAQQPGAPNPEIEAEREAARADLLQAEKLLNAGGSRGPAEAACKLMDSHFLHVIKVAAAAGAKTRIAAWSDLTWEEQNAVAEKASAHKVGANVERNKRLRVYACTAAKP